MPAGWKEKLRKNPFLQNVSSLKCIHIIIIIAGWKSDRNEIIPLDFAFTHPFLVLDAHYVRDMCVKTLNGEQMLFCSYKIVKPLDWSHTLCQLLALNQITRHFIFIAYCIILSINIIIVALDTNIHPNGTNNQITDITDITMKNFTINFNNFVEITTLYMNWSYIR